MSLRDTLRRAIESQSEIEAAEERAHQDDRPVGHEEVGPGLVGAVGVLRGYQFDFLITNPKHTSLQWIFRIIYNSSVFRPSCNGRTRTYDFQVMSLTS